MYIQDIFGNVSGGHAPSAPADKRERIGIDGLFLFLARTLVVLMLAAGTALWAIVVLGYFREVFMRLCLWDWTMIGEWTWLAM